MEVFERLGLNSEILQSIKGMGITTPTEIQGMSIPHIMEKKDVIGESATGSGKTLAFGCGIVAHTTPGAGLQSLILTPTRELAEQVKDALKQLSRSLKIISVYGGVAIDPQIHGLRTADVVVGTPGRLLDHLQRRTIDLSKVKILVLDEADRMLDMGFIDDVEKIIRPCPRERQTLFFSATISSQIRDLANRYMASPKQVRAKNQVDPSKLKQVYYDVLKNKKLSLLIHLLQNEKSGLVMVFCNSRRTVDFVVQNLKVNKVKAIAIHGGFSQNKRSKTMEMFNDAKAGVLVCTDVAARGLDIDNVSHIYNYESPNDPKDYVHRIGRTARAGEAGIAISLICEFDHENFGRMQREYRDFNIQKADAPQFKRVFAIKPKMDRNRFGNRRFSRGNSRGPSRGPSRGNSRGGPRGHSRGPSRGNSQGQTRRERARGRRGFSS
jgi:ATP-dependent RNA helicase DeaD